MFQMKLSGWFTLFLLVQSFSRWELLQVSGKCFYRQDAVPFILPNPNQANRSLSSFAVNLLADSWKKGRFSLYVYCFALMKLMETASFQMVLFYIFYVIVIFNVFTVKQSVLQSTVNVV